MLDHFVGAAIRKGREIILQVRLISSLLSCCLKEKILFAFHLISSFLLLYVFILVEVTHSRSYLGLRVSFEIHFTFWIVAKVTIICELYP